MDRGHSYIATWYNYHHTPIPLNENFKKKRKKKFKKEVYWRDVT
jgi:hypothetical protein